MSSEDVQIKITTDAFSMSQSKTLKYKNYNYICKIYYPIYTFFKTTLCNYEITCCVDQAGLAERELPACAFECWDSSHVPSHLVTHAHTYTHIDTNTHTHTPIYIKLSFFVLKQMSNFYFNFDVPHFNSEAWLF